MLSWIMFPRAIIREVVRPTRRLYQQSIGLAARSEQPYATHLPVLVGVAAAFSPASVIEFGSGIFSTLSFLDDLAFPTLKSTESYENNREWFEQIRAQIPPGGRVSLRFIDGKMYRAVNDAKVETAGMIFIDDSPTARARVPTVEAVARQCGSKPIVVLHDNDLWRLRIATRKFEHCVSFAAFNPQCCVMWHGHPEWRKVIENVAAIARRHAGEIPVTHARAWREVFSRDLCELNKPENRSERSFIL
jgi:hypothetical protein